MEFRIVEPRIPLNLTSIWQTDHQFHCLVLVVAISTARRLPLATLAPLAIQPPHSANRHDAGCRGAGADRVGGQKLIPYAGKPCLGKYQKPTELEQLRATIGMGLIFAALEKRR